MVSFKMVQHGSTNVSLAHTHGTMYHYSWAIHSEGLESYQSQLSDTLSPTIREDKHCINISLSSAPSSPSSSNCASSNALSRFSIGITRSITVFARSSVSFNKGANWGSRGTCRRWYQFYNRLVRAIRNVVKKGIYKLLVEIMKSLRRRSFQA